MASAQENVFGNALVPDMIADASIEYRDGTFYCYATTDGYGQGLKTSGPPVVWTSCDFLHWTFSGSYFPSAVDQLYWAPSKAVKVKDHYYIYPTVNGFIHVGVSDRPQGPFRLACGEDRFVKPYSQKSTLLKNGSRKGIDAEVFIDDDGQPYVFWQHRHAARLTRDMLSVDSATITTIPTKQKGYSEGPIFFKRKGIYYFLYTIGGDEKYQYYYMMSTVSPLGSYMAPENDLVTTTDVDRGVFGPGHGSVFNVNNNYYIAYLEFGRGSTNRQTYVSPLEFNDDGTIRPVKVSLDGVGALHQVDYGTDIPIVRITASSTASPLTIKPNQDERCRRTEYFLPEFATDHANGSRWMAADGDTCCWLVADLGTAQYVGRSEIAFVRPTAGHAYVLEGSLNGTTWIPCGGHADVQIRSPHVDQIERTFRYLRVKITKGIRGVWEWQLYKEGTYTNPVLPADFSDIDCIRVGNDYYAISSTFQFSPGMAILHSRNLVEWNICGHVVNNLTQISPELNWNRMNRYARGIWAGTLRWHHGKFYCVFGTPDEGYFITTAKKPEGPYKALRPLLRAEGWDDCTINWDENDNPWFMGTCFKNGYKTYIMPMNKSCTSLNRSKATLIHEGCGREANKLISHNGWYYLIYSEHHPETGRYVMAKRSRSIAGPYTQVRQLTRNVRDDDEPNQGGFVEGPDGQWYFFTHHGHGQWYGRAASLLPVTWIDDWPIPGKVAEDGLGVMVWEGKRPEKAELPKHNIHENFEGPLDPNLEWNYQPRRNMVSLKARKGWLRLKAFPQLEKGNMLKTSNMLTLRSWRAAHCSVTVKIDLSGMTEGCHAGICHFSNSWSMFGVTSKGGRYMLDFSTKDMGGTVNKGVINTSTIWLRTSWDSNGQSVYSYSLDGKQFIEIDQGYRLQWGNYRGDRTAIYCYNENGEKGYVDFDSLIAEYDSPIHSNKTLVGQKVK